MIKTTTSAYDRLLDALEKVRPTGENKAMACCPAHDDRNPSLSIKRSEGKVLVYCHAGCNTEQILDALQWHKRDLYDDGDGYTYTYDDATTRRYYNGDGKKKFSQTGHDDTKPTKLYRLHGLEVAKMAGKGVWLVEGEDDVHALETLGAIATTTRGGVGGMGKADLSPLYKMHVCAVVDRDEAGDRWAQYMRTMLEGKAKGIVFFHAKIGKDAQDHVAADLGLADFELYQFPPQESEQPEEKPQGRWIDLAYFLDGSYVPPEPSLGGQRDEDMISLIYPGRWHTVIGLTTAGKSLWALWHVKDVLEHGWHVVYIHFEEPQPGGTIQRLLDMGVDKEVILKQFHWASPEPWKRGEMAHEILSLPDTPALAVLDGINAACGQQGWDVSVANTVGEYRAMFVTPFTSQGTAVLSLGHPPKATNRQGESYSYGAAGWLNDVDGASFRMNASSNPISKGTKGSSAIYSVKDRYGEVQRWGELQTDKEMPWYYMGNFVVDSGPLADLSGKAKITMHLTCPRKSEDSQPNDKLDVLGDQILTYLRENTGKFQSVNWLAAGLRSKGLTITEADMKPALLRLLDRDLIEWPDVGERKARPGWLVDSASEADDS